MGETQTANPVTRIGLRTRTALDGARAVTIFTGNFLQATMAGVRRPRRLRVKEILFQMQKAGAEAMVLLAGLAFLMGGVIGIQAITIMSPFGAEARIAQVVTIITMQEIGPLLTAVLLAGRSGVAFAIEIGTGEAGRDTEALRERGADPMGELILPRVLALTIAGPLLAMITTAFSILGGMIVSLWIPHLSPLRYLLGAAEAMNTGFLIFGLAKILLFSGLVGMTGCFYGWRVTDPGGVKKGATSSFAVSLLLIVLLDTMFSLIYHIN